MESSELRATITACWDAARAVEPAAGAVSAAQLDHVRQAVATAVAARPAAVDGLTGAAREELENALATAVARAAAVAVAAGDDDTARAWLADARALSHDDDQREELAAAGASLERYRVLVHGRNRFAAGDTAGGRARWQELVDGDGPDDAIRRAAAGELSAVRPYQGNMPELFRRGGIGAGFVGARDHAPDGTYVTTYCLIALVPVLPLAAYRVLATRDGYIVTDKVPLSRLARALRVGAVAAAALAVIGYFVVGYLRDPDRLARQRFDAAIAAGGAPHDAIARLDEVLDGPDLARVDTARAERAGATVVRLTARLAPEPFTRADVDQASRLVARHGQLPERARGGAARAALLDTLTGWADALAAPDDRDARLTVLRQALAVADGGQAAALGERVTATRLEVAASKAAAWPLDALAVLVEEPGTPATLAAATEIVARLADRPSLLEDAGDDLDAWLAAAPAGPLRQQVEAQRALAVAARAEVEAEDVSPAQLAAMQAARPWDQRVAARLAAEELDADKAEAAEARLRGFGEPGLLTRDARLLLAQIAVSRDQLETADELLGQLLSSRLPRFLAASAALAEARQATLDRLERELDTAPPPELVAQLEALTDEARREERVQAWYAEGLEADPVVAARQATYLACADVVQVALASGTVKLRRAQGLDGADRDRLLTEAEKTFLAVSTEAEGQPEFHLLLGQVYARLGKARESDAELGALLTRKDPDLTMEVATVYRVLGSVERARQIAEEGYAAFDSPAREAFASFLGVLTADDDEVSEGWFRKADPSDPYVRTSLLTIEGRHQLSSGDLAACARTFAAAAAAHLAGARSDDPAGFNNAAVAHQARYDCSGDPTALADAQTEMERAYRLASDQPILLGNLIALLDHRGHLRVLARWVDVRALRLSEEDARTVLDWLLDSGERDRVLAALAAEPLLQRSRRLLDHYEVLTPNDVTPYRRQFTLARQRRDEAAAAAVLDRMRRATALDTSEQRAAYQRAVRDDAHDAVLASAALELARYDAVLARRDLDARTRATALRLRAAQLATQGLLRGATGDLAAARAAVLQADALWPATGAGLAAAASLVEELGIQHDARRWSELRRTRSVFATLARLADDGDPLAAAMRGSPAWAELGELARRDHGRPGVAQLRLARLLGDPELEARARAARGDELQRMHHELLRLIVPDDPEPAESLALLGPAPAAGAGEP